MYKRQAEWSNFLADGPALRPGLAKGTFDAFLLMPRGQRDEEFHTAVCELLSEWGATVPVPLVDSVQIVSDHSGGLTLAIPDYLDRVRAPNRPYPPASDPGRAPPVRRNTASRTCSSAPTRRAAAAVWSHASATSGAATSYP